MCTVYRPFDRRRSLASSADGAMPMNWTRVREITATTIFAFCTFGAGAAPAAGADIKIGYAAFMTGARTALGANELKAIQLAAKQINASGGINGTPVTLVVVDTQSTVTGAMAALKKVVEEDHVLALVGFTLSTQVLATSDAIRRYGIPTM